MSYYCRQIKLFKNCDTPSSAHVNRKNSICKRQLKTRALIFGIHSNYCRLNDFRFTYKQIIDIEVFTHTRLCLSK